MTETPPVGEASPYRAGLLCRCPRCGEGALYRGLLTVRDRCAVCDLDLRGEDSGDGPAAFLIFLVGFVVIGGVFWLEFTHAPAWWVHLLVWPPVTVLLTLALLRPAKALLIALQYRHKAGDRGDTFTR